MAVSKKKIIIFNDYKRIGPTIEFENSLYNTLTSIQPRFKTCQFMLGHKLSHNIRHIDDEDTIKSLEYLEKNNKTFYIHSPYVNNLAGEHRLSKTLPSINSMMKEVKKFPCAAVYHFGSVGSLNDIVDTINKVDIPVSNFKFMKYHFLLENSAGQGTQLGKTDEEIRKVFEGLDQRNRVGLCIDTCHAFAAGMYDLRKTESVINLFDNYEISMVHLNDSLTDFNSRKDSHSNICSGFIWKDSDESLKTLIDLCIDKNIDIISETKNPIDDSNRVIYNYF